MLFIFAVRSVSFTKLAESGLSFSIFEAFALKSVLVTKSVIFDILFLISLT